MYCPSQTLVTDFMDVKDSFNFSQKVQVSTHSKGHTLDLVLYNGFSPENLDTNNICVSDHKISFI